MSRKKVSWHLPFMSEEKYRITPFQYVGVGKGSVKYLIVALNPTYGKYPSDNDLVLTDALKESRISPKSDFLKDREMVFRNGNSIIFNKVTDIRITDLVKKVYFDEDIQKKIKEGYWTSNAFKQDRNEFISELNKYKPKVIIALGNVVYSILRKKLPDNIILKIPETLKDEKGQKISKVQKIIHYSARMEKNKKKDKLIEGLKKAMTMV